MTNNIKTNEIVATNQEEQLKLPAEVEYKTAFSNAVKLYEDKKFNEASKMFMDTYKKFPDQHELLVNYANCQYELFNVEEAVKNWKLVKEKDKYLINPYINLGNYYLASSKYEEAIEEFSNAFCICPSNETAILNLAIAYEKIGMSPKTYMLYDFFMSNTFNLGTTSYKSVHKKLAMAKLSAISHLKLAIYHEKRAYYRSALQSYYAALKVFPNFSKTYYNIANIFYKLEKYEQAKSYWLEAYKKDKNKPALLLNLGLCCEKLNDFVNAYAFYFKFSKLAHGSETLLAQESMQNMHTAIMLDATILENYKKQAEEYYKNKKYEDAIIYYENLNCLSHTNEFNDRINELNLASNIVYKAALTAFEIAKIAYANGDYNLALEKCKLSKSFWKNSYFEEEIITLMKNAQTDLGDSINHMLREKHE